MLWYLHHTIQFNEVLTYYPIIYFGLDKRQFYFHVFMAQTGLPPNVSGQVWLQQVPHHAYLVPGLSKRKVQWLLHVKTCHTLTHTYN